MSSGRVGRVGDGERRSDGEPRFGPRSTKDKEMWAGFEFYDCRSDLVHKYAGKPIKDTGEMGYCFVTLPDTYRTYPSFKREKGSVANAISSAMRVIRAGNMILVVSAFTRKDEWLLAQLDTAIKDLDLAAIAKW